MELSDEQLQRWRRSGLRLDAAGRFWHEGGEVTHRGLRAALFRWLDRESDGRWVLRLDAHRFVYLEVEDAPFVVRSLRWEGDRARVLLSDESEEELAYSSLRLGPEGVAYVRVKEGRFEARLSSAAWGALQARLIEQEGRAMLDAAGGPYPIDELRSER